MKLLLIQVFIKYVSLDLQINNIVKEVKGHFKEVNCVECSYQSPNIFLSTGTDGRIKLWDLNGMKCLADL